MGEKRLFHSIADQIAELIRDGVFPPGTRMPSERELAQRFGVGRVTIRDAEIALQAMGWLDVRTSSGAYVSEHPPHRFTDVAIFSAPELIEARLLLEAEAATLAAHSIREEDLDLLERLIRESASPDRLIAAQADREFHAVIVGASQNPAITYTIESLWRMSEQRPEFEALQNLVSETALDRRAQDYDAILAGLRARDPVTTRSAMRRHFSWLLETMLEVEEGLAREELSRRCAASRQRFLLSARAA